MAFVFSLTAISSSQRASKTKRRRLAHTGAVFNFSGEKPLPVGLFFALRLDDLEGHRLYGSGRSLALELALELLFGLLFLVLVFCLTATRRHSLPPVRWKHPDTTSIPPRDPILS